MYETEFLTASLTIIGGIIIFVVVQSINQFFLKPVVALREEIGRAFSTLILYVDIFQEPPLELTTELRKENSDRLKTNAFELMAKGNIVFGWVLKCCKLPKRKDIILVCKNMLFLSNKLYEDSPNYGEDEKSRINRIEVLLNIKLGIRGTLEGD